ncbi:hypothetical protein AUJ63_04220 [Candidatus Pacearchaeota archaeon CG1_02_35_32]|nr:MAG: hypothetical protein AUJ63_04220 [Candidatus Pacearchaeota archaeon CG1_02_35_32]
MLDTPFDIPAVDYGNQWDYKKLYYSDHMAALRVPVTLQKGYDLVRAGTTLARNISAGGGLNLLVPYNPTIFPVSIDIGRAYLITDSGALATTLYVTLEDSYKFMVGDDIIINDNSTAAENLGAITAIDRTTDSFRAAITVTTAVGATSFTTARRAHISVEAGNSSNNYSDCVGILEKTVNTGTGEKSKGAVSTLILGNCVLYEGLLTNLDAAAIVDLGASTFGQYVYIR